MMAYYYETILADDLTERAVAVWFYLSARANKDNQCWPSIRRMARDLHCSRSTIKRAIQDLEDSGWLIHEKRWHDSGGKTSSLYTVRK